MPPATSRNPTSNNLEAASQRQDANPSTTQSGDHPNNGGPGMDHVKKIMKNERVSIQVSAPGWIVFTAISLMRFMAKSTGTSVDVRFCHE